MVRALQDAPGVGRRRKGEILLLLARGEKEIAAGVSYSLEYVLAEADALLSED